MKKQVFIIIVLILVASGMFYLFFDSNEIVEPQQAISQIVCSDLSREECVGECEICSPCMACSSLSCQTSKFCRSIGFEPGWWDKMQAQVNSFEKCMAQGNSVMESYPRQCRVGDRIFVEEIGDVVNKIDLVQLDSVRPNDVVDSPLQITGQARGNWFFEGSFPVLLTNWDGLIIATGIARTKEEWMTADFVSFSAILEFIIPEYGDTGSLILQKDNPSDLPENDDAYEIPIRFR